MKKNLLYILLFTLPTFVFFSCAKDLNVAPQNIIQDATVFSSTSAIDAYFAALYNDLPIEDFLFTGGSFNNGNGPAGTSNITDESMTCLQDDGLGIGGGTSLGWWGYSSVRNVNQFIESVTKANFPAAQINEWLGEARFIRAYYYFGMVKRYGGVPLVTTVQDFTGSNLDQLKVPRNTEKEIYDFIASELDTAALLLNETSTIGRVNKYVAYALKSRAMIYAASEAEYGTVQLNGLVGIPASNAAGYWQAAYDAANMIMSSGKYTLYNESADKSANYTSAFLDVNSKENIFVRQFFYPNKAHSWDLWILPHGGTIGPSIGYGSRIDPSLELCNSYEYIDGSDGTLKFNDSSNNPIQYTTPSDIFKNKDPRLDATFLLPFGIWKGYTMDVRAGIIDNGQTITSGDYNTLYDNMHVIGLNGIGGGGELSQTGFYVRKYLQPAYDATTVVNWSSSQEFIDFRYGEILLNFAEAAVELGKTSDAMNAVNQVRSRAGIATLTLAQTTRDRIRHERRIELALEPHRYWDMRRWHIADQVLNNTTLTAILPYLVLSNNSYIYKTKPVGYPKTFTPNMYYERIDPGEISKNPNLIQNPGY
jgi:hypothetical protein